MSNITSSTFDREAMARWHAQQHADVDPGVDRILFLPQNAPPREIRFLEVNRLIAELDSPQPIDFGVDIRKDEGHKLNVLDVTPAQWEAIQNHTMSLPRGWSLDAAQELFSRPVT